MLARLLYSLFLLCTISAAGQFANPYFTTLSVQDGLLDDIARSEFEDANGYNWFGTKNGLVRYDGNEIKNYTLYSQQKIAQTAVLVSYIFQDKKGIIWAFTSNHGIYFYDAEKDAFRRFILKEKYENHISDNTIFPVINGIEAHVIWLINYNMEQNLLELLQLNTETAELVDYSSVSKNAASFPVKTPLLVFRANCNQLWLAGANKLCIWNSKTKQFTTQFMLPKILSNAEILEVIVDPIETEIFWKNNYSGNFTVESGNKKLRGKGTGLGLSMSYDIITNGHNGELNVQSIQNTGTTFIIQLPFKT